MRIKFEEVRKAAERMQMHVSSPVYGGMKRGSPYWRPASSIAAGRGYYTDQLESDKGVLALAFVTELSMRDAEVEKLRALVSKLRNYDACNESDVNEAACAIERLAGLDCGES